MCLTVFLWCWNVSYLFYSLQEIWLAIQGVRFVSCEVFGHSWVKSHFFSIFSPVKDTIAWQYEHFISMAICFSSTGLDAMSRIWRGWKMSVVWIWLTTDWQILPMGWYTEEEFASTRVQINVHPVNELCSIQLQLHSERVYPLACSLHTSHGRTNDGIW